MRKEPSKLIEGKNEKMPVTNIFSHPYPNPGMQKIITKSAELDALFTKYYETLKQKQWNVTK